MQHHKTYYPPAFGIEMWLDEGGRLFLSDPSRFGLDYPKLKHKGYPMQPDAPEAFILPVGNGAVRFEYRFTIKTKRIFEATAILTADELKKNPPALWSGAVGLHREQSGD